MTASATGTPAWHTVRGAQVYPATGINGNFQWCGVGFSQLPSGIGFGGAAGALGQFALYLDSTLDSGMSRPIATYGSPSLASEQLFQVGPGREGGGRGRGAWARAHVAALQVSGVCLARRGGRSASQRASA